MSYVETAHFYIAGKSYTPDPSSSGFDFSQTTSTGNLAQTLELGEVSFVAGIRVESDLAASLEGISASFSVIARPPIEGDLASTLDGISGQALVSYYPSKDSYDDLFVFTYPYTPDSSASNFLYADPDANIAGVVDTLSASFEVLFPPSGVFQDVLLDGVSGSFVGDVWQAAGVEASLDGISGQAEGWQPPYFDPNFVTSATYQLYAGTQLDPVTFDFTQTLNEGIFSSVIDGPEGLFVAGNNIEGQIAGVVGISQANFVGTNERFYDINFVTSSVYELQEGTDLDPVVFNVLTTEAIGNLSGEIGLTGEFVAGNPLDANFAATLNLSGEFVVGQNQYVDIDATIDGVSASFVAGQNQYADIAATLSGLQQADIEGFTSIWSNFDGTISGLTGSSIAANAPQADIGGTISGLSAFFSATNPVFADIEATLEGVSGNFEGSAPLEGNLSATLEGPTGDLDGNYADNLGVFQPAVIGNVVGGFIGEYDPNMNRFIRYGAPESSQQDATHLPTVDTVVIREQGTFFNIDANSVQEDALNPGTALVCGSWQDTTRLDVFAELSIQQSTWLDGYTLCAFWDDTTPVDTGRIQVPSIAATFLDDKTCMIMQQMTPVYPDKFRINLENTADWQIDSLEIVREFFDNDYLISTTFQNFGTYTADNRVIFHKYKQYESNYKPNPYLSDFGGFEASTGDSNFTFDTPLYPYTQVSYAHSHTKGILPWTFESSFQLATYVDKKRCAIYTDTSRPPEGTTPIVDPPRPDPDPDPPSGVTITVPEQEVYTVLNNILVTLSDDVTEIELDNISLALDADSTSWTFSAELVDTTQLNLIRPNTDGTAVELHITINGYAWHVLVEKPVTTRSFEGRQIRLSGRGKTSLLGKPYVQAISSTQGSLLTVQQIADLYVPLGWTLNWESPVWNVDGGAFSFNNLTNIEVLSLIAGNIGASLVPARDTQSLTMRPRYPVLPWNFDGTAVDVAIPDSAIYEVTEEPTSAFYANGVYVHGGDIGGEIGFCRLTGTAGDKLLATVQNSLMTDPTALRALGERLLAGEYTQPTIQSFTTFMDGTTVPLLEIGTFVGITVDGVETKGIVNAISISVSATDVMQSIRIGENTNNSWQAFNELLPKDPLLLAQLASTDGATSTMTLLDSGVIRVRGTGTVGANYYVQTGQIQSEAPNLPSSEIVI